MKQKLSQRFKQKTSEFKAKLQRELSSGDAHFFLKCRNYLNPNKSIIVDAILMAAFAVLCAAMLVPALVVVGFMILISPIVTIVSQSPKLRGQAIFGLFVGASIAAAALASIAFLPPVHALLMGASALQLVMLGAAALVVVGAAAFVGHGIAVSGFISYQGFLKHGLTIHMDRHGSLLIREGKFPYSKKQSDKDYEQKGPRFRYELDKSFDEAPEGVESSTP